MSTRYPKLPFDFADVLCITGLGLLWYGVSGFDVRVACIVVGVIVAGIGITGATR